MFEFLSTILEAINGYIGRRYATFKQKNYYVRITLVSITCGLIFFLAYGLYELLFPAPNPLGNIWLGLTFISVVLMLVIFLFLVTVDFFDKNKNQQILTELEIFMENITLLRCLFFSIILGLIIGQFARLPMAHTLLITVILAVFFILRLIVYGNITLRELHQHMMCTSKKTIISRIYPFDVIVVLIVISTIIL